MRLVTFSVKKFRSITDAHKIKLSNVSTLVGKNNEWKSNILKALNISMNILKRHWNQRIIRRWIGLRKWNENEYNWDRDFPIQLQDTRSRQVTIFSLEFEMSDEESINFKKEIWSTVNWVIDIRIELWSNNQPEIKIIKKWGTWDKKSSKIADYIAQRINITYIPAIRTEDHANDIVESMISLELSSIETDKDYIDAMNKISDLQQPILKALSKKIEKSLIKFIPDINSVEAKTSESRRRIWLRKSCEIVIDDWNKTNLEFKWDWVKSLVALSLLKDANIWKWFSLIAIEEPESHLHPWAIHSLREAIY